MKSLIRDLDTIAQTAKSDFAQNIIPCIIEKYRDIDKGKLTELCKDFFEIYCELEQISAANSGTNTISAAYLESDIHAQWQYYAAFFYKRLTSDCSLNCTYYPAELNYLELTMSCAKEDTLGLDSRKGYRVFGSLIRSAMDMSEKHFGQEAINSTRIIPFLNSTSDSRLLTRFGEGSQVGRLMAEPPSAQGHVPNLSELVLSA